MKINMKLFSDPFERIKSGSKIIEVRLFDDKRKKLNIGDIICFVKLPEKEEIVDVEVVGLFRYASFKDLFLDFGSKYYGYSEDFSTEDFVKSCREIYSAEDENRYGVLGIKVRLVK